MRSAAGAPVVQAGAAAQAAAAPMAAPAPAPTPAPVPTPAPAPVAARPLALLGAALRSAHGDTAQALAQAIAAGQARATLDRELVDAAGFPILSTRSTAASDSALTRQVQACLAQQGLACAPFNDAQWRALSLGTAVLRELALLAQAVLAQAVLAQSAPGQLRSAQAFPAPLRWLPLLPLEWSAPQRQAAHAWFQQTLADCGWPMAARLAQHGGQGLAAALAALQQGGDTGAVLVFACNSAIAQEQVDAWETRAALLTSTNSAGSLPGEGAAGLLLTTLAQALAGGVHGAGVLGPLVWAPLGEAGGTAAGQGAAITAWAGNPPTLQVDVGATEPTNQQVNAGATMPANQRIDAGATGPANQPINAPATVRARTALLGTLAEQACAQGDTPGAAVQLLVADTDSGAARLGPLLGMAGTVFPELDTASAVVGAGHDGNGEAVNALSALALALHHCQHRAAPVLYLGNGMESGYAAALLRPWPGPALA